MIVIKWAGRLLLVIAGLIVVLAIYLRFFMDGVQLDATGTKLILNAITGQTGDAVTEEQVKQGLTVDDGFSISLFANGFANARFMRVSSAGDVLLSNPRSNQVLLISTDEQGNAAEQRVLLDNLNKPHGLDIHQGFLYVGELDAIGKIAFNEADGTVSGSYQRIVTGLTGDGNHWTKTVAVGDDGWLYAAMGSTCNVCVEEDERRATIMRYKTDGSQGEIYAKGLRNSVGFDWAPWSGDLYATDNGRDLLGDDFPPCELNRIEKDAHYGFPFANGNKIKDPDFGDHPQAVIAESQAPVFDFPPHNAPLGIAFIDAKGMPDQYQRSALVALHGSWNRSQRDGYKVVRLSWDEQNNITTSDFLTGFLSGDNVIGRPVDVAQAPDGTIYVSDDYSGSIYKIRYGDEAAAAAPMQVEQSAKIEAGNPLQDISAATIAEAISVGSTIYKQFNCAMCHEPQGGNFIKALDKVHEKYSAEQLADFFQAPTPPMPRFPFSDAQRQQLAIYLLAESTNQ